VISCLPKPAPDIYQYVHWVMGLSAQDCIAFEDSHHGFFASGVGLKTVITVNEYTKPRFSGARLVLNHLGEPERPFTVLAGDVGNMSYQIWHWCNVCMHDNQLALDQSVVPIVFW